tara:strand:- start:401 stop:895 length:495 start_codon:yes stop_codon:yes gene_type:complete
MTGVLLIPTISAQTPELKTEQSVYEKIVGQSILTKFFGHIENLDKGGRITLTITSPSGTVTENKIYPSNNGYFELFFPLDKHAEIGLYDATAIYSNEVIGTTSFDLIDNGNYSLSTQTILNETPQIPSWIKNIFIWYGDDMVSEKELISAIKFLVNDGIINLNN